jgi:hypothetical protein
MPRFSKIGILIFLTLIISASFCISHFSKAENGTNNVLATSISNQDLEYSADFNSFNEGTVYICPDTTSLEEINPRCSGKIILKLGETINGVTLTTTNYEGQDYYLVIGFTNGGGAYNLPPEANANGPYQGYAGLPITFNGLNSKDPNGDPLQYRWDFDNDGIWETNWLNASTTEHIWNDDFEGIVKLEVSDGEFSAIATTSVKVISPKTLKQDAVAELEDAKTGDKRTDQNIDQIIKHIQNSLDDNLWVDSSHLVFFKKDCLDPEILQLNSDAVDLEKMFEFEPEQMELEMKELFKGKCFAPKIGLRVFHEEYIAIKLMLIELKEKPQNSDGLKPVFEKVITKLVKADQLLAKASLYEAKNTSIQNPKFKKIVEKQIEKSEEELLKSEEELSENRPDKANIRLAKSWLHSQLAIKFAILEVKP